MSAESQITLLPEPLRYRFSTFDLDLHSGELRRNGVKLRLQEQPFLVLRKLLESAGKVVTREELHAALWPADTFVDFDTSLNTAIKRLREALGDSADLPVFIETIPRRGYRFLAPVQVVRNGALSRPPEPITLAVAASKSSRNISMLIVLCLVFVALVGGFTVGGFTVALRSPSASPRILDSTQLTFDGLTKNGLTARAGNVYFNERLSNQARLVKMSQAGGLPVVLDSSLPGLDIGDVSADGTKLIVGSRAGSKSGYDKVKIMDMATGSVQDIPGIEASDAEWAPGGKIIYSQERDVFLVDADGSNQHKLLTAPATAFGFHFSPDSSRLRFTIGGKNTTHRSLWEASADGAGLHEILMELTDYPDRGFGCWSQDGRYYFFNTFRNGSGRIWVQSQKKSFWTKKLPAPIALTTAPPNYFMALQNQVGTKLLVTATEPRAELVRYDSSSQQFVPFLSGISAGDVESSRDARSYTYVRYPEETLWRSKSDGSEAVQLTGPSLRATLPHWSPDGKQIAFSGSRPGKPWNIFIIPAQGGPAEQITNGALSDLDAAWSPDGKTLAFGQLREEGSKQIYSVQLLDLATRRQTAIPATDGICCPRWSPDGRYLMTTHADNSGILLYEFVTRKWSTIVKDMPGIGYMEWSADSKNILFDTSEVEEPAFYRVRLADAHLETIIKINDVRRYYGEFGPWAGATPDGTPLLIRDISNEEVYSLDLQLP